jgi:predicted acyltransferase
MNGPAPGAAGHRLDSLDAFRGLTVAAMLVVNNPGTWSAIYPPLEHAEWNGWTPTDLIFPFFLFIVGVAMAFSLVRRLEAGAARSAILRKAVTRAVILFGLGLLLQGFPRYDLAHLRIPGVLQRIALAYLAASLLLLNVGRRALVPAAAVLLAGYWLLVTRVPVPGAGAGILEPGRDLGAWIDRVVFGEAHLWAQSRTWDPEGLLSTIPAVATVLTGLMAGYVLRSDGTVTRRLGTLLLAGVALAATGQAWNANFPINKSLWTSSYVLFTSGLGFIALAACWFVIDVRGRRRWAVPFIAFGRNAILAFFLSGVMARLLGLIRVPRGDGTVSLKAAIYGSVFEPVAPPELASLLFALAFLLVWIAITWALHRRHLYLKV